MTIERFVHGIWHAVHLFKLAAWTICAIGAPAMFVMMHNYLGVFVMGLISAFIGRFAFGPNAVNFRGSNLLRNGLILQGILFSLYGGHILFSPSGPWEQVTTGGRTSLVLNKNGEVFGVEFREHDSGFRHFDPVAQKWSREDFPGKFVVDIFLSPDEKQILAPEDRSPTIWIHEAGKWSARRTEKRLRKEDILCKDFGAAPFVPEICARGSDGTFWIARSELFKGPLAVRTPSGDYRELQLPAPRPEAMYLNANNPQEIWIAFWGSGVYRTLDRGVSWHLMGLKGSEVTALVVDFVRKVAYASTGSGIFALKLE